jgi:hypothetical protein
MRHEDTAGFRSALSYRRIQKATQTSRFCGLAIQGGLPAARRTQNPLMQIHVGLKLECHGRYVAYQHAAAEGRDDRLCTNFRLWQLQGVHEAISRTLVKAQLRYDQFLITRTILTFLTLDVSKHSGTFLANTL